MTTTRRSLLKGTFVSEQTYKINKTQGCICKYEPILSTSSNPNYYKLLTMTMKSGCPLHDRQEKIKDELAHRQPQRREPLSLSYLNNNLPYFETYLSEEALKVYSNRPCGIERIKQFEVQGLSVRHLGKLVTSDDLSDFANVGFMAWHTACFAKMFNYCVKKKLLSGGVICGAFWMLLFHRDQAERHRGMMLLYPLSHLSREALNQLLSAGDDLVEYFTLEGDLPHSW